MSGLEISYYTDFVSSAGGVVTPPFFVLFLVFLSLLQFSVDLSLALLE